MDASWNLPPPPGFCGLHNDLSLSDYQRHLPHWRQDGATYFVTFRLHDSLPQSKLQELEMFKADWRRRSPPPHSPGEAEQLTREVMRRVEAWLDQGMGSCLLRSGEVAAILADTLHCDDGREQELDCYVVMPNHVHALVRPLAPAELPLETILQRWKGKSSCLINRYLQRTGTLWQRESFDRIVRDEEHLYRAIQYIGRNPKNAGLLPTDFRLWIRPSWEDAGWRCAP